MAVPSVTITQIDGALGVIPPQDGDIAAVVGPSTTGTNNVPVAFARSTDVKAYFGAGPLVEMAGYLIDKTGKPVVCVKAAAGTAGACGTIDVTGVTGTSVATFDNAAACDDEYEVYVKVIAGGTIGQAGITFQYSLDGGRTMSATTALGTANTYTIPLTGGIKINFAAGTLVAGDIIRSRTTPPTESTAEIQAALAGLAASRLEWDFVVTANILDATKIAAVDSWCGTQFALGNHKKFMANVRGPNVGETEAQYLTALTSLLASTTTIYGSIWGGYTKTLSSISSRQYRRPVAWVVAARAASSAISSHGVSLAKVALGPLWSDVKIHDANGNPDEHDEYLNPGLDALKLGTLRSFPRRQGIYITRDRLLCPAGSDFNRWAYRGVLNDAADALLSYLELRLEGEIRVDRKTGYILEEEALDIEKGGEAAMRAAVMTVPDASDVSFVVSRTDNLLSTSTLHTHARIVPLAYADTIGVTLGFNNPASRVVAV